MFFYAFKAISVYFVANSIKHLANDRATFHHFFFYYLF